LLRALGFSEVLSREVAPLGIKVTIVEPGGFRTDFAGSSTKLSEGNPDYDSTVGATARFQRDYNGKQPGDPKKAAQAIVRLTQEQKPPLRLLLGSDAYNGAEKNDLARLEEARAWKELSLSTDFESKPPHLERPKRTYLRGNPAHGRAAFSGRANRGSTLRIFCFAGSCQRPPKARRRCSPPAELVAGWWLCDVVTTSINYMIGTTLDRWLVGRTCSNHSSPWEKK
jgi:hypothetical protein